MLRESAGPGAAVERYEIISRFLSSTEEYLHKLAGKVASVKLQQEASEAAALAISRARAQVRARVACSGAARCMRLALPNDRQSPRC